MPLFNRNKPAKPTDAELQAAEADLERIRQGGIPLGAEERLKRLSSVSKPFFTSDLSAKEYAVAEAGGLQPIAQVMGSSVVKHGWNRGQSLYYTVGELQALSQPWNMVRERAFDRLLEEATLAGADAVVGVKLDTNGVGDPGNVELVVFGTAVRDPTLPEKWRPSSPESRRPVALSTLNAQDVDKLRRIGAEICGVVGHTTVQSVQLTYGSQWIMNAGTGFIGSRPSNMNAEIPEITQGVYQARRAVMRNIEAQARQLGANQLVMSALNHSIEHYEYEYGGGKSDYFHVTMHVLGTAIRLGMREPHPAPLKTPMMSINLGDQS